jgi:First Longin domain of INTU, CCZ1 and HPS4
MSDEVDHYLSCAVVFHRRLGCADESSSDDEQSERILFYYPTDTSVFGQLSRLSMIESLIVFTNKFSSEPIEFVTMVDDTWAFFECERDVWIVIAVKNNPKPLKGATFRHRPNGRAMVRSLQRIAQMFYTFNGGIERFLQGPMKDGWQTIDAVQQNKKRIRKLGLRMQQESQDCEAAKRGHVACGGEDEEEPATGAEVVLSPEDLRRIANCESTVAATVRAIEIETQALRRLVSSDSYRPSLLSSEVSGFMHWFLLSGELFSPSVFHSLRGQHLGSPEAAEFQNIVRVRQAAQEASGGLCRGCLLLNDGAVLWSDFEPLVSLSLCDFIHLQEAKAVRYLTSICTSFFPLCVIYHPSSSAFGTNTMQNPFSIL